MGKKGYHLTIVRIISLEFLFISQGISEDQKHPLEAKRYQAFKNKY